MREIERLQVQKEREKGREGQVSGLLSLVFCPGEHLRSPVPRGVTSDLSVIRGLFRLSF